MHKAFRSLAHIATLSAAMFITFGAFFLFNKTAIAAPAAQTSLPDFTINTNTVLTVTVAITGGQVIVVPLDLNLVIRNEDGDTEVSLLTDVEQQAGIFIGVSPEPVIAATLELPQSENVAAVTITGNSRGTHVANRNSNQRSGPGTNFDIVGRVPAGGVVTVVGENEDGTWLLLDNGNWVAEFLLDPVEPGDLDDDNADSDDNGNTEDDDADDTNNDDDTDGDGANTITDDEAETTPISASDEETLTTEDDADLATYLAQLVSIGGEASASINTLRALVQIPDPLSAQWRSDVGAQLALLSGVLDQYLTLSPVPGYEGLHAEVIETALTCEQAVDYLAAGLGGQSAIDPVFANQSVVACTAQATGLAAQIESLQ